MAQFHAVFTKCNMFLKNSPLLPGLILKRCQIFCMVAIFNKYNVLQCLLMISSGYPGGARALQCESVLIMFIT